jgi:hypothetical protein
MRRKITSIFVSSRSEPSFDAGEPTKQNSARPPTCQPPVEWPEDVTAGALSPAL